MGKSIDDLIKRVGGRVPPEANKYLGSEDVGGMTGPLRFAGLARNVLYKTVARGLKRKQKLNLAKELRGIPQKELDRIKSIKTEKLAPGVQAKMSPAGHLAKDLTVSSKKRIRKIPGTLSHETAHASYWDLSKESIKGLARETKGLSKRAVKSLEKKSGVKGMRSPQERFAESSAQQNLKSVGLKSKEKVFPPYVRELTKRAKKKGRI